jgi:Ca-activated chloride channel family protein
VRAAARSTATNEAPVEGASRDVLLNFAAGARTQGDPRVMNIVEKATAFKLQTRALEEAEIGNVEAASRNLRSAATRLLNLGETDLAQAAESEAQQLEQRGQMSSAGTKKLTFATRKLAVDDVVAATTPAASPPDAAGGPAPAAPAAEQ